MPTGQGRLNVWNETRHGEVYRHNDSGSRGSGAASSLSKEVHPEEAITPARVREIHREQLAKLEAEQGDRFWVLEKAA